jgi:hypothetical protein
MDLSTHLTLAAKLLDSCGLSRRAAIFSLLPEIDIEPAHYHRMFGNILMYQTRLLDAGIEIFRHPEVAQRDFAALRKRLAPVIQELKEEHGRVESQAGPASFEAQDTFNRHYCYSRLVQELPGFFAELEKVRPVLGEEVLQPSTDRTEGAVALVSHTYFVSYTFPPMPFIPFSPMASQRIAFADRIDYFEFKGLFWDGARVAELRRRLMEHPCLWTRTLDFSAEKDPVILARVQSANGTPYAAQALVKAMIERLGELAPGIDYDAVQKGIRWYLGYLGCVRVVHSDRERHFLEHVDRQFEESLISLMDEASA